ncbi:MAG: hypothetical protein R3B60_01470 [Candidatus Paceibacterota bacterium]
MKLKYKAGLELEVFTLRNGKTIPNLSQIIDKINKGKHFDILSVELGARMLEAITPTYQSTEDLLLSLRTTIDCLPSDWQIYYSASDPYSNGEAVELVETPRYVAIINAVRQEKSDSWQGVLQFTKWCSLHVNIGINPWSPLGLLIMNTINNVAPYIGFMTREDFPESRGHMAIWRGWTDEARLPRYGEKYNSFSNFSNRFKLTKKLIRKVSDDNWSPDLKQSRDPFDRSDLGTNWKFCRPKLSENGVWYIEIRVLPSMSLKNVEEYVSLLLFGINAILEGFNPEEYEVTDIDFATGVASKVSRLFPVKSLTEDEWENYFHS